MQSILSMRILGLLLLISLFAVGCGSNSKGQAAGSQVTLTVTGTSGAISQSAPVALTIN